MKKFFKKHLGLIFLIILVLVFPTGLSNQAKLNMRIIVTGLAIDKNDEEYEVTAQIVKATPGNEKPGTSATIDFVSDKATTISEAMSKISYKSGKVSAFSHTNFIILGEGVRNEKATKCLDYFIRDKIVKSSTMLVFSNEKAKDEIKKTKTIDLSVGLGLQKTFLYKEYESDGIMTTVLDFVTKSSSFGKCAVASELKFESEKSESESNQQSSSESTASQLSNSGESQGSQKTEYLVSNAPIMCFEKGEFKGKLESDEEINGYMFASQKAKSSDFVVDEIKHKNLENAKVTIIMKDKITFGKVEYKNNKPVLTISVVVNNAEIAEILNEKSIINISPDEYKAIEKALKKHIQKNIHTCFDKSKTLGVDLFGAYEKAYKFKYNETTKKYKTTKEFIDDLTLNVDVKVQKLDY